MKKAFRKLTEAELALAFHGMAALLYRTGHELFCECELHVLREDLRNEIGRRFEAEEAENERLAEEGA